MPIFFGKINEELSVSYEKGAECRLILRKKNNSYFKILDTDRVKEVGLGVTSKEKEVWVSIDFMLKLLEEMDRRL